MKAKAHPHSLIQNPIARILLGVGVVLLIPLAFMQFTDDVTWSTADFVVAGTLLFGAGLLYELMNRKVRTKRYRLILGTLLAVAFVYLWVELAVGVFTDWGN